MLLNNNIILLNSLNSREVGKGIASRVKLRRLELNLTQEGLALRADVKLPTYRRFEQTGEISLSALLRIAMALDALGDFNQLFAQRKYESIDEILQNSKTKRKRGKKNE
ncbi:MAG: helix-turn-helix transcriptional regulator [Bacteroidales bacterium]|nr:helix-turn-helix transcriptional regulator [Bacteroidales bacterium]